MSNDDISSADDLEPVLLEPLRALLAQEIPSGWEYDGVCAQADPESWFPEAGSFAPRQVYEICASCSTRRPCLAAALLGREYGIWAGTSEAERRDGRRLLRAGMHVPSVLAQLLSLPLTRTRAYGDSEQTPATENRVA